MRNSHRACLSLLALACASATAGAVEIPVVSLADVSAATAPAATEKTPVTVTMYWENDGGFANPGGTDRHYTSGEALSIAWQPKWAADVGSYLPFAEYFKPGDKGVGYAVGLIGVQQIYTPKDHDLVTPDPDDRPYAGALYMGVYYQRANEHNLDHIQLNIGMVGPSSLARQAQDMIHDSFGFDKFKGWDHQLHDEPGADLIYVHKWRYDLWSNDTWTLQAIPDAGFTAGTFHRNAQADITTRFGYLLPDDFGPGSIKLPGSATGTPYYRLHPEKVPLAGYVFGRLGGRLVQSDVTIEGNNYRDSAGLDALPAVGEMEVGIGLQIFKYIQFTWSTQYTTEEFRGQEGGDVLGRMTLGAGWEF